MSDSILALYEHVHFCAAMFLSEKRRHPAEKPALGETRTKNFVNTGINVRFIRLLLDICY